jgi:hypothetical protein
VTGAVDICISRWEMEELMAGAMIDGTAALAETIPLYACP